MLHPNLRHLHAVAFDLDGVLYEGDMPVPGAADAVAAVRAAGLIVRFVTNTTSISRRLIVERLAKFGFSARVDELLCPSSAAAAWLRAEQASAALFVPRAALEDFVGVRIEETRPDAVVIGDLDVEWDFDRLNRAFRFVHEHGARLIGLGRTRYWKSPSGLQLDVGPFLAALECATGQTALVFGKPEPAFFAAVVESIGGPADRIAMVGDDILSDVGAAMKSGMFGVLVQTGKFRSSDLDGSVRPDLVVSSAADLVRI
jgi:phospholysine phosphohistidine inorganic pyrophosphate phosphatase